MADLRHAILGLPKSGKTTFLAALWHVLDAGEIDSQLKLKKLVGNSKYLNAIVEAWRRCEEVPRTSSAAEETVSIYAEDRNGTQEILLSFPDLSGESFERQFAFRACSEEYVSGFESEGGILLFLNADRPFDGMNIVDMPGDDDEQGDDNADQPVDADAQAEVAATAPKWTAGVVPEQAQLVDLLQMIQERPFLRKRRRLAVVVSAWDVILDNALSPTAWLSRERPLIAQFLRNNAASFEVQIYGLSAQGGRTSDDEKARLLALTPSERIICVTPSKTDHDISAPLVWLSEAI